MLYVNNLTIMGNSLNLIQHIKEALKEKFQLKDLGKLKHYLDICVTQDRRSKLVYLNQEVYI